MSILIHKKYMRWEIVLPVKHSMIYLMLLLKETEIKAEMVPWVATTVTSKTHRYLP